jgi:hypothetical protein
MMSTSGGNLKGEPPQRLAADLGQFTCRLAAQAPNRDRLPGLAPEYDAERLCEGSDRPDIGSIDSDGFGSAIGSQHSRETRRLRHQARPKPTPGRPNRPIKSQLPQGDDGRRLGRDQPGCHQYTDGNRQVIGGADLRKVGWGKIDDHPPMWKSKT